jgi:hypothetical protein
VIQYICESCAMVKAPDDPWILGLAAEALGVSGARREVTILPGWDLDRSVHPLAVHFCSLGCKDRYIARLFGDDTLKQQTIAERTVTRSGKNGGVKEKSRSRRGRSKKAA